MRRALHLYDISKGALHPKYFTKVQVSLLKNIPFYQKILRFHLQVITHKNHNHIYRHIRYHIPSQYVTHFIVTFGPFFLLKVATVAWSFQSTTLDTIMVKNVNVLYKHKRQEKKKARC